MLFSIFFFGVVGGLNWDLDFKTPEPYVGYHLGLQATRTKGEKESRENFFRVGSPFPFLLVEHSRLGSMSLRLLPELTIGKRIFGLGVAAGPEFETDMGTYAHPMALFYGAQLGVQGSFVYSDSGIGTEMSDFDRVSFMGLMNLYFGPNLKFVPLVDLKLQFNLQAGLGKIAENTTRSSFSNFVSLTGGLNLQVAF